jgi:hypothetical protein
MTPQPDAAPYTVWPAAPHLTATGTHLPPDTPTLPNTHRNLPFLTLRCHAFLKLLNTLPSLVQTWNAGMYSTTAPAAPSTPSWWAAATTRSGAARTTARAPRRSSVPPAPTARARSPSCAPWDVTATARVFPTAPAQARLVLILRCCFKYDLHYSCHADSNTNMLSSCIVGPCPPGFYCPGGTVDPLPCAPTEYSTGIVAVCSKCPGTRTTPLLCQHEKGCCFRG